MPENTEEITQMIDHINLTKTKGIADLQKKCMVSNLMVGSSSKKYYTEFFRMSKQLP